MNNDTKKRLSEMLDEITKAQRKNRIRYTLEEHIKSLIEILDLPAVCEICPAESYKQWMLRQRAFYGKDLSQRAIYGKDLGLREWYEEYESVCVVCNDFIGFDEANSFQCPCDVLGKDEAVEKTWKAIEEYVPHIVSQFNSLNEF